MHLRGKRTFTIVISIVSPLSSSSLFPHFFFLRILWNVRVKIRNLLSKFDVSLLILQEIVRLCSSFDKTDRLLRSFATKLRGNCLSLKLDLENYLFSCVSPRIKCHNFIFIPVEYLFNSFPFCVSALSHCYYISLELITTKWFMWLNRHGWNKRSRRTES